MCKCVHDIIVQLNGNLANLAELPSPSCPPTPTAGLRELDRLVELDLTDNMLSKHSSLEPFQNLHHLAAVSSS